jgi:hypothetical protein
VKVLFASHSGCDWIASTLYQGFLEVVGEENLYDASGGDRSLPGPGVQAKKVLGPETGFDLLVVNACFRSQHGWDWIVGHLGVETRGLPNARLLSTCKIVYVEGYDHAWDINPPPFHCDAIFRREIEPGGPYPYSCEPLLFAMPWSCFDWTPRDRHIDVACLINCKGIGVRHETLAAVDSLRGKYAIASCGAGVPHGDYKWSLYHAKLTICPPGGGSDCMHPWEAIAYGSIPVFVGHPDRVREPWFGDGQVFWCNHPGELPRFLEWALQQDLEGIRHRLQGQAKTFHTTRRRAERVLSKVFNG